MFAYGTEDCEPTDLVTGPGNVYVASAKRLLKGVVGIDAEAGPTEIGILADDTADPAFVAADLVAQAEHDANASCLLVTPSPALLDAVDAELARQVPATRHREAGRDRAAQPVGLRARRRPRAGPRRRRRVGGRAPRGAHPRRPALGRPSHQRRRGVRRPVRPGVLGDYLAGSNHVLPTGGTSRHTGGLSVQSFLRSVHVVDYTRDALAEVAPHIDALGGGEDLHAHVDAVRARIPRSPS